MKKNLNLLALLSACVYKTPYFRETIIFFVYNRFLYLVMILYWSKYAEGKLKRFSIPTV